MKKELQGAEPPVIHTAHSCWSFHSNIKFAKESRMTGRTRREPRVVQTCWMSSCLQHRIKIQRMIHLPRCMWKTHAASPMLVYWDFWVWQNPICWLDFHSKMLQQTRSHWWEDQAHQGFWLSNKLVNCCQTPKIISRQAYSSIQTRRTNQLSREDGNWSIGQADIDSGSMTCSDINRQNLSWQKLWPNVSSTLPIESVMAHTMAKISSL